MVFMSVWYGFMVVSDFGGGRNFVAREVVVGVSGCGCGWTFGGVVVWRRSEFLGVVVVVVA